MCYLSDWTYEEATLVHLVSIECKHEHLHIQEWKIEGCQNQKEYAKNGQEHCKK